MSEDDECHLVSNKKFNENYDYSGQKDGCLVRSSIVSKHKTEVRRVKVHNDISIKYALEKRSITCGKRLPRCRLGEIIHDITSKYGLNSTNVYSIAIRKRETRSGDIIVMVVVFHRW